MHRLALASLTLALCILVAPTLVAAEPSVAKPAAPSAAGIEFFEKQVRPLLVKHCYECHSAGSKEVKGSLSLDTRGGWQAGGDSGPSIVPGKPDESLLIEALRYESYEMPPAGKLSDAEIAVFVKWVEMGAPDPRDGEPTVQSEQPKPKKLDLEAAREYWAFQLPESHHPPLVHNTDWPRDDLDRFILAKLEAAGLAPSPEADRPTWLRRVTYDLTGLPPTPAELQAFLADDSPEAYARVVDRLLASKEFGVHWGRHWLDVARYADSNGSDFNATFFNAWRYRDYVIDSVNNDRPYDEFVRMQIGGDLLPYSSDAERYENLVASTFVMIGPKMLSERDKEKMTMDVVDEQIDSLGKAFLGLTIGCARCHDHKFDPIPTADYYALAGIFTSTVTLEGESQKYVSAWKETPLPIPPEHAAAIEKHKQEAGRLNAALNQARKDLKAAEEQLARLGRSDGGVLVDDTDAKKVGQWKASTYSPNFVGKGYVHDEKSGQGTKSITWTPDLPHAGIYEVRISYAGANGRDSAVPVTISYAEGVTDLKLDQTQVAPIDKLFKSLGTFPFDAGTAGSVSLSNTGTSGFVLADAVLFLPVGPPSGPAVAQKPQDPDGKLVAAEKAVAEAKRRVTSGEAALKELEKNAPPPQPTAMAPREAPEIGDCRICVRGEHKNRGKTMPRGFLQVISAGPVHIENTDQSGRLELAEWIARPDNPLTARVFVNRVWQKMIGEGLVRTVDNFGHLGERPTHPELLDTLAVDFVEDGWSTKRLVRRIALSATYRQESGVRSQGSGVRENDSSFGTPVRSDESPESDAQPSTLNPQRTDPENRLLWRAHRKRVTAESLRDAMLAVSGELDRSPGGSPVAGLGYLAINNSNQASSGRDTATLRRSVYLPIIRNELPTFLTTFDFADPDVVTGRRSETNVPAQALFLLNDPFVKQRSKETAETLLADASATDSDRIVEAYRLILTRTPTADEMQRAEAFIAAGKDHSESWRQFVQALFASTEFRMLD